MSQKLFIVFSCLFFSHDQKGHKKTPRCRPPGGACEIFSMTHPKKEKIMISFCFGYFSAK